MSLGRNSNRVFEGRTMLGFAKLKSEFLLYPPSPLQDVPKKSLLLECPVGQFWKPAE